MLLCQPPNMLMSSKTGKTHTSLQTTTEPQNRTALHRLTTALEAGATCLLHPKRTCMEAKGLEFRVLGS